MLTKSGLAETFNETGATLDASVMPTAAGHHQKFSGSGGRDALQNETTNLPANAQKRLPFHIFMVEDKEAYEKYQTPFVHNEIDIYNVEVERFFYGIFKNLFIKFVSTGSALWRRQK